MCSIESFHHLIEVSTCISAISAGSLAHRKTEAIGSAACAEVAISMLGRLQSSQIGAPAPTGLRRGVPRTISSPYKPGDTSVVVSPIGRAPWLERNRQARGNNAEQAI